MQKQHVNSFGREFFARDSLKLNEKFFVCLDTERHQIHYKNNNNIFLHCHVAKLSHNICDCDEYCILCLQLLKAFVSQTQMK